MTDTRSEFFANLALVDDTPSWQKPSRCKRPAYLMDGGRRRQVEPREDGWRDSPPGSEPYPEGVEIANEVAIDPDRVFPSPPPEPATGFWHRLLVLICGH